MSRISYCKEESGFDETTVGGTMANAYRAFREVDTSSGVLTSYGGLREYCCRVKRHHDGGPYGWVVSVIWTTKLLGQKL